MRVMLCTRSGAGHFGPLVPFANAFLRAGDDVVVVAPASCAEMIAGAGLDHLRIPDPPPEPRSAIFAQAGQMSVDAANDLVLRELFVRIDTRHAFPHAVAAIESWRPDAIVFETSDFAAALAAEATGVPAAGLGITQRWFMDERAPVLAPALDELRADLGLPPDPEMRCLNGVPYLTLFPEALEDPATLRDALRFREEGDPPQPLPGWWANTDWPLVYLTFGSFTGSLPLFPGLYRDAIDALSYLPVRVLVTIGKDRDPLELGALAPNVHATRWVPQADVMPHAAAMVCHGGSGTVRAGLAAGMPMAVLPLLADQPHNARRVAELGAGIELDGPAGITDAVRALLADPSYRHNARRVAADIRRLPTVEEARTVLRRISGS